MIPKAIHYCWFGYNPKPKLAEKCIKSWKRFCPDYEIIEWNEDNYDVSLAPLYVRQAYEAKKWAFVSDYVRLDLIYQHGGIYLDTDVQLIKNIDFLLGDSAFFGFEREYINTGLGFGAEKGSTILVDLMHQYQSIPFILPDGSYDMLNCPERNTKVFIQHGLISNGTDQMLEDGIHIYPSDVFCPKNSSYLIEKTTRTVSIHWYAESWLSDEDKIKKADYLRRLKIERFLHLPNYLGMKMLGTENYEKLKEAVKRK